MTVATTLIPTEAPKAEQSQLPSVESATDVALRALAGEVRRGKGGPVLVGALAGALAALVVSGAALWLHMSTGDRGVSKRVENLERWQQWNSWALQSMAQAQGVELPPPPGSPPPPP